MVQRDLISGIRHSDDDYVRKCAKSDYLHYELQGLEPPAQISVNIVQAGPLLRSLRTVEFDSSLFVTAAQAPEVPEIEEEPAASAQTESAAAESFDPRSALSDLDASIAAFKAKADEMMRAMVEKLNDCGNPAAKGS